MIALVYLLNYGAIIFTLVLTALGVALGQGYAALGAMQATNIQPMSTNEITRTLVLAMALMETGAVIGLALSIVLLIDPTVKEPILAGGIARFGIPLCVCLCGISIGIVSSWLTRQACMSIARQPFFNKNILNLLLITQSLLQTPLIFSFIVSWIIKMQAASAVFIIDGWRLLASGLVMGLGSIGPIIGLALFACAALEGIGRNRKAYPKMLTFTFISQAIIETPILFSFIIALMMLFTPITGKDTFLKGVIMMAAALSTGLTTMVPGINSGKIASAAGRQLALNPDNYSILSRTSMLAQALIDTFVLYGALISMLMLLISP